MIGQKYRDIVVGSIAWTDYNKSADLLGLALTIALVLGFAALAIRQLHRHLPTAWQSRLLQPWSLAPALAIAAGVCTVLVIRDQLSMPLPLPAIIAASIVASLLVALSTQEAQWVERFWPAFFTALHALFAVLGVLSLVEWLAPGFNQVRHAWPLFFFALGLFAVCFFTKPASRLHRRLLASGWWQLPIPLLLFKLTTVTQAKGDELLTLAPEGAGVWIVSTAVVLLGALQVRSLLRDPDPHSRPVTLFVVGAFLAYVIPLASPLLMHDFHLGELALPWHQIILKGSRPYADYVPIQGWLGFFSGAFHAFLYDGKMATLLVAKAFAEALVGGTCAVLASRVAGPRLVWFLLPALHIFPEAGDRLLLIAPFTLLLLDPAVVRRPALRLLAWPLLAAVHCLYNAPAGIAWTVATSPLAYMNRRNANAKQWGIAVGVYALFILTTFPWLAGWLHFLRNNGSSNDVAYGLGLLQINSSLPSNVDNAQVRITLEILRTGGWVLAMGLGALFAFAHRPGSKHSHSDAVYFGAALFIIPFLLVPYTLGRMDPFELSRTGVASLVCLGIMGTFACLWALTRWPMAPLWSVALGVCLGYSQAFFPTNVVEIVQRPSLPMQVPTEMVKVEGDQFGMPRAGTFFTRPDRWQEVTAFHDTIQKFKLAGESYLDLTNRSALYVLVDEKCPVPLASDYHAFNQSLQEDNLRAIQAHPPALVWIGPALRHDAGPASLRNYRVYRWLVESGLYFPQTNGSMDILLHQSKRKPGAPDSATEAALWEKWFRPATVGLIPTAWGKSWATLAGHFTTLLDVPHPPALVSKTDPSRILASVQDGKLNPGKERPDFLLLEIGSEGPNLRGGKGTVRWRHSGADKPGGSLEFNWKPGIALVPVGSSPAWLTTDTVADLEIELDSQPPAQLRRLTALRLIH